LQPRCGYGPRAGLLGLEQRVELLIGHHVWLTRADFAAAALTSGDGISGAAMMSVDFEAALAADPAARYTDLGPGYYQARTDKDTKVKNHIRRIEALVGHPITITPKAA
jgi:hypothetical protein